MEAIRKYLILSMLTLMAMGGLYFSAAKSLSPVLPLQLELRDLPMLDLTSRDPGLTNDLIQDDMEHEAKLEKYKALEKQLAKVTNENQKEFY